ncbi:MAG: YfhO family protein [Acidobacteria bacterium]|nr:YfhO family protein [Acidobacteriota bacterium]
MTGESPPRTEDRQAPILSRREWIWASLALALQSALFLAPALLTSKVLLPADLLASYVPWAASEEVVPQNANLSDLLQQFYPYLEFFSTEIRRGHFPLWNPYVLCGAPFLANSVSAILFPVTWMVLLLPTEIFFEWSAFLKLFLAGLGIYAFSRSALHLRPLIAWCVAAVYSFSGYSVYFLGFPNTYVTALLPWCLLALDRGFLRSDVRSRWLFSLLVGAMLLAGHIESAVLALLFFMLYAAVLLLDSGPRQMHGPPLTAVRFLLPLLFHLVCGVILAAAGLLPFFDYLQESATWVSRTQETNPFHISLLRLPALWIPYFFGSPIFNPREATVGQMEQCIFLGAIPLLLAVYGMPRSCNRRAPAIVAGLLASFVITFGIWPFFQLFTSLPLLRQGNHIHAIQIFQFCAALLSGLGLQRWSGSEARLRILPAVFLMLHLGLLLWQWSLFARFPFLNFQSAVPWYGIITLLFALLFCATQFKPAWAPALLAALLPALGFLYGFYFNPAVSPHWLRQPGIAGGIERQARVAGIGDGTLLPNMSMSMHLRDLRGYESVVLSRTQFFFDRLTGKVNDPQHSIHQVDQSMARVLQQCGVQYLLSPAPLLVPGWSETARGGAFLYRTAHEVSRAQYFAGARAATTEQSLQALLSAQTAETLFLEAPGVQERPPAPAAVRLVEETPNRMRYAVAAGAPGYLLIRESYDKEWEARVDGKSARILHANFLFMALAVPQGDSVVELSYRPAGWLWGLALSLVALPLVLGGILRGR